MNGYRELSNFLENTAGSSKPATPEHEQCAADVLVQLSVGAFLAVAVWSVWSVFEAVTTTVVVSDPQIICGPFAL